MAVDKTKFIVSPKGLAKFPKIVEPEEYQGKHNYTIQLVLDGEDAVKFESELEKYREEFVEDFLNSLAPKDREKVTKYKFAPISYESTDRDGNVVPGEKVFKFKKAAKIKKRNGEIIDIPPVEVRDAKRQVIKNPPKIGFGSEIKIAFRPLAYENASSKSKGISLRLEAVQLLNLKSYSGGGDAFGEEEGYEVNSSEETPFTEANGAEGNSDF